MSNLRHLMNHDDEVEGGNRSTAINGTDTYKTHRSVNNSFSINNLVNGPVPSNTNNQEDHQAAPLPKLEYNYATPQQNSLYSSGVSGFLNTQSPSIQPATDNEEQQHTPTNSISQEQILASFERIKTHFPAARIKKIMQSDEEIGKVAQATPIIVGRALEIFMANLVEVSVLQAKQQGVKRITASHVKSAIENTEQFDFLVEAVEKYPSLKN
ncbi:hypothetical protein KGF57_004856 [Candida theae]|uniref:Transcription factor CBF/NF-Y/archaeal histone domain-containing protein n=1 Tax=Candida theae TaxID=1198502 RepID=A0AAD5FWM8_9ASCO|nr:uncharacterized protein KGF57_004856 [Candida theae]KAI5949257.1 hypothetical protein KGF57_004856 [Candida theae]